MSRLSHARAAGIVLILALLACNLPSNTSGSQGASAVLTAAAATVNAELTAGPGATDTPAPSSAATSTPFYTPTSQCDVGKFVSDINIPDGTVFAAGATFTKTWRLQNIGSCTWSGYSVVFDTGNSMGGPAISAINTTPPGASVDISVNLTAPSTNGSYRGYWRIRNASGQLIPIQGGYNSKSFYVDIQVSGGGGGGNTNTITLTAISSEGGSVRSDGTVLVSVPNAGDTETNATSEAFFSFKITGIPAGATITKVVTNLAGYDTLGNPWGLSDGCVRAYAQNFGSLSAGDYFTGDPLGAIGRWCSTADLDTNSAQGDMVAALQAKVGSARFQFRMQFRTPTTNGDGIADMVRFGAIKLTVTYTTP
jgi:hypothetical protein